MLKFELVRDTVYGISLKVSVNEYYTFSIYGDSYEYSKDFFYLKKDGAVIFLKYDELREIKIEESLINKEILEK